MSQGKYFINYRGWIAHCDEKTKDGVYCTETRDGGDSREEAQEAIIEHIKKVHKGDD